MQEISDLIGKNQFGRCGVECVDCCLMFEMQFERVGPDSIEIKNGAIGKRDGEYLFKCPRCFEKDQSFGQDCEIYSRVVGYMRPISGWNPGKKAEFEQRKTFDVPLGE